MMRKLMKIWPLILVSILVMSGVRVILFSDRLIGHNWDFTFPYPDNLFSRISLFSNYTWFDFNLGSRLMLTISHIIPNNLISLLGSFLGPIATTKCLIISVILFSFFSYKKFLDYLTEARTINYLFSLLFAFSPFLFNEFIGGSWYMWISFAISPIFLLSSLQLILHDKWNYILPFILTSIFTISSLQNFACLQVILVSFLFYKGLKNSTLTKLLSRYIFLHSILIVVNSYWILNLIFSLGEFNATVISNKSFTGDFNSVRNSLQSIVNVMNLGGYLDRNLYLYVIPPELRQLFFLNVFFAWGLIFFSFLHLRFRNKKNNSIAYFWLLLFFLTLFIVKGGNKPYSDLTMEIFNKIPFMRLFRSPQHLMFFPAFILPILLSYSFSILKEHGYKKIVVVFSLIIGIWISGWFITGDFGKSTLTMQKKDHIDLFTLSPELDQLYKKDYSDPLNYNIIFLPTVQSPIYKKTKYQGSAQGHIPEYLYLKHPTFTAEFNQFAQIFENSLCKNDTLDIVRYLNLFSVKNIILRKDIHPEFTDCRNIFDFVKVKKQLDKNNKLEKIYSSEYLINYEIKSQYVRLPIYTPKYVVVESGDIDVLSNIINQKKDIQSMTLVFKNQNKDKEISKIQSVSPSNGNTVLEYKKINPTKYHLYITNAPKKFLITFSSRFDSQWKIYSSNRKEGNSSINFASHILSGTKQNDNLHGGNWYDVIFKKEIIDEKFHYISNAYSNSWLIDSKEICLLTNCQDYEDNSFDIDIFIEFKQQKYLYLGSMISLLSFLSILVTLFVRKVKLKLI